MEDTTCHEHSGCMADIAMLKNETDKQWRSISTTNKKVDTIMARLNVILGSIVVAAILLAINIALSKI